jgi:hypothetical protein
MRAKTSLAVALLLMAAFWAAAQQQTHRKPPASSAEAISDEQVRAAHSDLQRMRTLVQQMQMNLVSLPPGPTPLRHQFELEIEMWQTLITHIERQLQTTSHGPPER